jgi:hypothetical protein
MAKEKTELEKVQAGTASEIERIARAIPLRFPGVTALERISNAVGSLSRSQAGGSPPIGTSASPKTATARPSLHQQIVNRAIDDARGGHQIMADLPVSPLTRKLYQDTRLRIANGTEALLNLKDPIKQANFERHLIGPEIVKRQAMLSALSPDRLRLIRQRSPAADRANSPIQSRAASPAATR